MKDKEKKIEDVWKAVGPTAAQTAALENTFSKKGKRGKKRCSGWWNADECVCVYSKYMRDNR